ncbi:hypothetical protein [Epilithonimonas tenax]|uniref:hypothetical protein n=1 Tax=Epilithonimonas tenax TaxID=191577 RepID=UPI0004809A30|nr:hypothetical protein [Epilithonimonas tenax]
MELNNEDQSFIDLLHLAIKKMIADLQDSDHVRKIIINHLTDQEIAEISLYHAGDVRLREQTTDKIHAIWRAYLKEADPALYEYIETHNL